MIGYHWRGDRAHRDQKPANVMLTKSGATPTLFKGKLVKVADRADENRVVNLKIIELSSRK
jgi:hypothetical protein